MPQLIHKNVQVSMCRLLKAIPPGIHTVQAVPNPPSLPTFLMSLFFMYLLIFKLAIGNLERSYFFLSNMAKLGLTGSKILEDRHTVKSHEKILHKINTILSKYLGINS